LSYSSFRAKNDIATLQNRFNKLDGKRDFSDLDDTYWTTTHVAGAEGVGEAIVRFLPAPPKPNDSEGTGITQEPDNIVKYFNFSIRKNGKMYINRGRNTLGSDEPDPANDYNKSIWERKDLSKDEKKKLLINRGEYYIANILVIKDVNRPENEGKVFRWRFGRQIYNMINAQLFPEFETDKPINVFDPIDGANFHFRVTSKTIPDSVTGELRRVPNYENSKFASPSALCSLEDFDEIWMREHSLQSEIAPSKFKPYDELKKQLDRVMGTEEKSFLDEPVTQRPKEKSTAPVTSPRESAVKPAETASDDDAPWFQEEVAQPADSVAATTTTATAADDDDWFSRLS
jgi:hypothetical protein